MTFNTARILFIIAILVLGGIIGVVSSGLYRHNKDEQLTLLHSKQLIMELMEAEKQDFEVQVAICNTEKDAQAEEFKIRLQQIAWRVDSLNRRADSILHQINYKVR